MKTVLKDMMIYHKGTFSKGSVVIEDGVIADLIFGEVSEICDHTVELSEGYVFPGLTDVHVHLREPGFSYKETILSGSKASAHGGFTHICAMPNLNPVPDSMDNLNVQRKCIEKAGLIDVIPYGSITVEQKGEKLSDLSSMATFVAGFSDDGKGVQNPELMEKAMEKAKALGKLIVAHCEDESLLHGGYVHDGQYARENGHKGICSESEWGPIKRDLALLRKTGCAYHVCHISTKESVEIIRQAKKEGIDITCETGPHYLLLNDMDLQDEGRFKMNPPIRSEEDRLALLEGIKDGTIDMIATDHAPHSEEEKSKGLRGSLNGIVGIELSFPVLYTGLVKTGILSLQQLIKLMHDNPKKRFRIGGEIEIGQKADLTVFDLGREYTITPEMLLSMGKSTPFMGRSVFGKCILTMYDGKTVWQDEEIQEIEA